VEGALVGEEGIIELDEVRRSFGKGHIKKLFLDKASSDRVMPKCDIYDKCGGCHLQHMLYNAQLEFKKQRVIDAYKRIGGFDNVNVLDTLTSNEQFHYRNKVQIPFGYKSNKTISGFYERETHRIIPITSCYLQSDEATEVIKFIKNLCNEFKIKGYDEETRQGDIKHVLIKESSINHELMVILITKQKEIRYLDNLVTKLKNRFSQITSIIQNINPKETNVILGEDDIVLFGNDYIIDKIGEKTFKIGVKSFFQINSYTTNLLYQKAIEMAQFKPTDTIIDSYSGIGSIGITIGSNVKKIYQVEIVKEAVEFSKENAKLNNITNIESYCEDTLVQLKKWKEENKQIDAIIVDPPRKGIDIELMNIISEMNIKKVLYISCDVTTQARDVKYLVSKGYTFGDVQPVDMFPNTLHVETIVTLVK